MMVGTCATDNYCNSNFDIDPISINDNLVYTFNVTTSHLYDYDFDIGCSQDCDDGEVESNLTKTEEHECYDIYDLKLNTNVIDWKEGEIDVPIFCTISREDTIWYLSEMTISIEHKMNGKFSVDLGTQYENVGKLSVTLNGEIEVLMSHEKVHKGDVVTIWLHLLSLSDDLQIDSVESFSAYSDYNDYHHYIEEGVQVSDFLVDDSEYVDKLQFMIPSEWFEYETHNVTLNGSVKLVFDEDRRRRMNSNTNIGFVINLVIDGKDYNVTGNILELHDKSNFIAEFFENNAMNLMIGLSLFLGFVIIIILIVICCRYKKKPSSVVYDNDLNF